jgi:hypothetical protein
MFRPIFEISINGVIINFLNELEIVSSWETYTDTGKIMFPIKFKDPSKGITASVDSLFKRGDEVIVKCGYAPTLVQIFQGYVSKIKPDSPCTVEVEDAAFLLKQENTSFSKTGITLAGLIQDQIGNLVPYNIVQDATNPTNLGDIKTKGRPNLIQVLKKLRGTYGIVSYFREGVLQVGLKYYPETSRTHNIKFEERIIGNPQLDFIKEDDIKLVVRGQNRTGNKKTELYAYYENGQILVSPLKQEGDVTKTLPTIGLTEAQLEAKLREELPKYIYTGYRGNFTTFGFPVIKHGDTVALSSSKFPERDGSYKVDKVITRFTTSTGLKQIVTLGVKVST